MTSLQCQLCKHGSTKPGLATVTLQRGSTTLIIKAVPAGICENCAEYYLDENTTRQVLSMAEEAVKNRAEVEILSFAA
jgi:YgiT-type zinc finger domain-containing protein